MKLERDRIVTRLGRLLGVAVVALGQVGCTTPAPVVDLGYMVMEQCNVPEDEIPEGVLAEDIILKSGLGVKLGGRLVNSLGGGRWNFALDPEVTYLPEEEIFVGFRDDVIALAATGGVDMVLRVKGEVSGSRTKIVVLGDCEYPGEPRTFQEAEAGR